MKIISDALLVALGCFIGLRAASTDYPAELVVASVLFCALGSALGEHFARRAGRDGS